MAKNGKTPEAKTPSVKTSAPKVVRAKHLDESEREKLIAAVLKKITRKELSLLFKGGGGKGGDCTGPTGDPSPRGLVSTASPMMPRSTPTFLVKLGAAACPGDYTITGLVYKVEGTNGVTFDGTSLPAGWTYSGKNPIFIAPLATSPSSKVDPSSSSTTTEVSNTPFSLAATTTPPTPSSPGTTAGPGTVIVTIVSGTAVFSGSRIPGTGICFPSAGAALNLFFY